MSPTINTVQAPSSQRGGTQDGSGLSRRPFDLRNSIWSKLPAVNPVRDKDVQLPEQPTIQEPSNINGLLPYSNPSTASGSTDPCVHAGKALPGTELRYFNQPIPPQNANDFKDIKGHFAGPLRDTIAKKRKVTGDIEMKLKYLGVTASSVELYIIVLCEKKSAKIARKFFSQAHISEVIRGCGFQLLVLDAQLMRLANKDTFQVSADERPERTWCGTSVTIANNNGSSVSATIGGIVMLEDQAGRKSIYGLTTSHILDKLRPASLQASEASDPGFNSDSDSDSSVDTVRDQPLQFSTEHEAAIALDRHHVEVTAHTLHRVGSVAFNSLEPDTNPGLDWALVRFNKTELLPNMIARGTQQQKFNVVWQHYNDSKANGQSEGIPLTVADNTDHEDCISLAVLVYTNRGPQSAILSFNGSSILIASGSQFVDIYDLSMSPNSGLQQGDSGSWVLDASTGCVYGLVVSFDIFGEVQVMPMNSVLEGIKNVLQVTRVSLPNADEIDELRRGSQPKPGDTVREESGPSNALIQDEELDSTPSTPNDTEAMSHRDWKFWRLRNSSHESLSSSDSEASTAMTVPSISSPDDRTLVPIPCEFQLYTNCSSTFNSISDFVQHSLEHHLQPLPETSICLHCDTWIFATPPKSPGLRQRFFIERLRHIGAHYLDEMPGRIRLDHFVLKHLHHNGTITTEQYHKLNTSESKEVERFMRGLMDIRPPSKGRYTEEVAGAQGRARREAKYRRATKHQREK